MEFGMLWFRYIIAQITCSVLGTAENSSWVGKLFSEGECSYVWRILYLKSVITDNVQEEQWFCLTGEDERKQVNK